MLMNTTSFCLDHGSEVDVNKDSTLSGQQKRAEKNSLGIFIDFLWKNLLENVYFYPDLIILLKP